MKINVKRHLVPLANLISAGEFTAAADRIDALRKRSPGKHWRLYLGRLAVLLRAPEDPVVGFSIIRPGNSKLGTKFLAFSTLPATEAGGIACPGAGDCATWCYSRGAWRYPAAFCRQAQNSVLMQTVAGRDRIRAALATPKGFKVFRLYVDGDFSGRAPVAGQDDVQFWWDTLADLPQLAAYGYSKSYKQILAAGPAPGNYMFNISGGHNHDGDTVVAAAALHASRGSFLAVDYARVHSSAGHGERAHRRLLIDVHTRVTGRKAFACPGVCNTCTPAGHACGSERFRNIDIIIAIH